MGTWNTISKTIVMRFKFEGKVEINIFHANISLKCYNSLTLDCYLINDSFCSLLKWQHLSALIFKIVIYLRFLLIPRWTREKLKNNLSSHFRTSAWWFNLYWTVSIWICCISWLMDSYNLFAFTCRVLVFERYLQKTHRS